MPLRAAEAERGKDARHAGSGALRWEGAGVRQLRQLLLLLAFRNPIAPRAAAGAPGAADRRPSGARRVQGLSAAARLRPHQPRRVLPLGQVARPHFPRGLRQSGRP